MKSNFKHDCIQEALTMLLGIALNFADMSSGGPEEKSSFMPVEKEWLDCVNRILSYGVDDSARAAGKWSLFCDGREAEV